MGQHKHNETTKLAKEGKLPPKEHRLSTAEIRLILKPPTDQQTRDKRRALLAGKSIEKRVNGYFLIDNEETDQ